MTSRQLYEGLLIELNKVNAPNILLEDFNYFANKAINQYVNKRYNIYDINQQTTDDLRVLKATAILKPKRLSTYDALSLSRGKMATYYVDLPSDYLHLLNCICIYNVNKTYKCYNKGDTWRAAATRLTADAYSQVLDNFWLRPTYKRPYYYIHNINQQSNYIPTNPYRYDEEGNLIGTDSLIEEPSDSHSINNYSDEDSSSSDSENSSNNQQNTTTIKLGIVVNGPKEIQYGEDFPEVTYSCNNKNLIENYQPNISISPEVSNSPSVGTYIATISRGNIPNNINIEYDKNRETINIERKPLTIELNPQYSKDYYSGDTLPTFTLDDLVIKENLPYGETKEGIFRNQPNPQISINQTIIQHDGKDCYELSIRKQTLANYVINSGIIGYLEVKTRKSVEDKLTIIVNDIEKTYGDDIVIKKGTSYTLQNGELDVKNPLGPIFSAQNEEGTIYKIDSSLPAGEYDIILSSNVTNSDYILKNQNNTTPKITINKAKITIGLMSVSMEQDDELTVDTANETYTIIRGNYDPQTQEETYVIENIFTYTGFVNGDTKQTVIKKNPDVKLGNNVVTTISGTNLSGSNTLVLDTTDIFNTGYSNNYEVNSEVGGSATLTVLPDSYSSSTRISINIQDYTCRYGDTPLLTYRVAGEIATKNNGTDGIVLAVYNGNTKITDYSTLSPGTSYLIKYDSSSSSNQDVDVSDEGVLTVIKGNLRIGLSGPIQLKVSDIEGTTLENYLSKTALSTILNNQHLSVTINPNIQIDDIANLKILSIEKSNIETIESPVGTYKVYLGGLAPQSKYDIIYQESVLEIVSDIALVFPDDGWEYDKVEVPKDLFRWGGTVNKVRNVNFDILFFDTTTKNINRAGNMYFLPGKDGKVILRKPYSTEIFIDSDGNPRFVDFLYNSAGSIIVTSIKEEKDGNGIIKRNSNSEPVLEITYGQYNGNTLNDYTPTESDIIVGYNVYEEISRDREISSYDDLDWYIKKYDMEETPLYEIYNGETHTINNTKTLTGQENSGIVTLSNDVQVKKATTSESIKVLDESYYSYYNMDTSGNAVSLNEDGKSVQDIISENPALIKFLELRKILNIGKEQYDEGFISNLNSLSNLSNINFSYGPFIKKWSDKKRNYVYVSFSKWTMAINGTTYDCEVGKPIPFLGKLSATDEDNGLPEFKLDGTTINDWTIKIDKNDSNYKELGSEKISFIEDWELEGLIGGNNSYILVDGEERKYFGYFWIQETYIPGFPSPKVNKDKWINLKDYSKIFEIYRRIKKNGPQVDSSEIESSMLVPIEVNGNKSEYLVQYGYWKRDSKTWEILLSQDVTTISETTTDEEGLDVTVEKTGVTPLKFVKIENFPPNNYRCKSPGAIHYYRNNNDNSLISPFELDYYYDYSTEWQELKNTSGYTEYYKPYLKPEDFGWDWKWNDNRSGKWCNRCGYWKNSALESNIVKIDGEECYQYISNQYDCDCDKSQEPSSRPVSPARAPRSTEVLIVQGVTPPNFITIEGNQAISNVERGQGIRYGNVSRVRLEIRYGTDTSVFSLDYEEGRDGGLVYIDYLKAPQYIRLTQEELDLTEDTSQMLEYPDYVCQEIINELTHIVMENQGDPKLQTHPVVSQSIANPAQTQAPEAAGQSAQ